MFIFRHQISKFLREMHCKEKIEILFFTKCHNNKKFTDGTGDAQIRANKALYNRSRVRWRKINNKSKSTRLIGSGDL
jgi:hypothetical protein